MATRMEKYKRNAVKSSRSSRNKNLYNTMYDLESYSNISGALPMDKKNEIDILKVKELIDTRESIHSKRGRRTEKDSSDIPSVIKRYTDETPKSYDIMDVLKEAREKKEPDDKERVLNNTNYDVLKKLNLERNEEKSLEVKKEDLKDLIETISNTSMLNKASDEDLATDMFQDLISDDTKVGELDNISEYIDKNNETMDDSFFTGKIRKADFVSGSQKSGSPLKSFFITLFVILILCSLVIFLIYKFGLFK